jgi:DNA-binding response OmpR family regulator
MSVKAMKSGAVEFLTKPFRQQELLDAVQRSLTRDRIIREKDLACIFFIAWPRCILTVASLAPSSAAICLFSIPETTRVITSRSRTLNVLYRCRISAASFC